MFCLICRHIYVADVLDHNVHVLERREGNALVPVKVNNYFSSMHYTFIVLFILYNTSV